MARYSGPKCRLCRKEGQPLFLKGYRCTTSKCPIVKKRGLPGLHKTLLKKPSEYEKQLRAKQMVKHVYGIFERQFRRYFSIAAKSKGLTGYNLLLLLETRLDNVVNKLGFTTSLAFSRQIVRHGHIKVNGRRVDIPSYQVKPNDKIELDKKIQQNQFIKQIIDENSKKGNIPAWLHLDVSSLTGTVLRYPTREEMSIPYDPERPKEQLIVELYSK